MHEYNIKSVDSLGRIVIPSGVRKSLKIGEDTLLGINVIDSKIVLSKIDVIETKNNQVLLNILKDILDTDVIITNLTKVIASTKKELINSKLTARFCEVVGKRKKELINGLQIVENSNLNSNFLVYPILKDSNLYGSIVIFLKNIENFNKNEVILDSIIKLYLETYI